VRTIAFGAAWAIFGAALQCSAQNHTWMIFSRLINGWGTGVLVGVNLIWLAMNGFMLTDVIWCRTLLCRSGQRRRLNTLPEVREDQTLQWIIWSFSVVVSDGKHASLFVSEGGDMITHVVERSLEMLRTTSFHLSGCIDLRDIHDCDLATMQQWEDWMRGHPRFPRLCADLTSSACRTIHCDRVYSQHLWCGGKS
jgi:hypothetical protein